MAKEVQTAANGSAAYDLYRESVARPLVQPKRLPDAPVRFPPVKKVKAKLSVAPLTVLGIVAVFVMFFVMIHSYASLYEAESRVAALEQEHASLVAQQQDLLLRYERSVDMEQVAQRASELGMHLPTAQQIVYVDVASGAAPTELNSFRAFYAAFLRHLGDQGEYFS